MQLCLCSAVDEQWRMGGLKKKTGREEMKDLPDNLLYKGQPSVILLYTIELQINPRN